MLSPLNKKNRYKALLLSSQHGLTLLELLIATVLSMAVIVVASTVYLSTTKSFTTTDASAQLNDSARFATYILRRMVQQAGYEDYASDGVTSRSGRRFPKDPVTCVETDVCGFDNLQGTVDDIKGNQVSTSGTLDDAKYYTDTLVVRFQGQSTTNSDGMKTSTPDGSMIDCFGSAVPSSTTSPPTRAFSSLYVAINSVTKEPELYCSSLGVDGQTRTATPIVRGVESFQVVYEVGDDTEKTTKNAATGVSEKARDGVPDNFRWLRANEIAGLGIFNPTAKEPDATQVVPTAINNWQHVVAVRFGMVLRSELGAVTEPKAAQELYPLGKEFASDSDKGTKFTPPIDTRLRKVVTFTAHVRNLGAAFVAETGR